MNRNARQTGIALLASAIALSAAASAASGEIARGESFARWSAREVTVGNGRFSAAFRMRSGVLQPVSFAANGVELLLAGGGNDGDELAVAEAPAGWSAAGERELAVAVSSGGRTAVMRIWRQAGGPMVEEEASSPLPDAPGAADWGSKVFSFGWSRFASLDRCGGAYSFAAPHLSVQAITPIDRTDLHAELLDTREFSMPSCETMTYLRCGVLDVRDVIAGRGIVFMRLAPMPLSRIDPNAFDFALNPATRGVRTVPNGYPLAMLSYEGGEFGRARALRDFQRSLWPRKPGRDGLLLSNTWGDGNRDSRINEDFLSKEIEAGADIGVEVVQIDDGWQKGRSANSSKSNGKGVWNGFWAADPEFWAPDPQRFPNGLAPLASLAKSKGLSLGLWFGPDSTDDAANWERDADCLLGFHRQFGICHFKIDALKLRSAVAQERNRSFFGKMLRESDFRMCFDLDCTAEVRPGFLGGMPVGPLFVENRYAHRKGDRRIYRPHQTLRSLWSLARLIDPVRLRMEFLNPAKKVSEYGDDPLRPSAWPEDALFAMAMLGSPLAWMELSDVPETVRAKWRPLIALWKRERDRLHDCIVVPVGAKPDGVAWTGFLSVGEVGGYALVFRELNADGEWHLDLRPWFGRKGLAASVLSGSGRASVDDGTLRVEIPHKLGYLWISLAPR